MSSPTHIPSAENTSAILRSDAENKNNTTIDITPNYANMKAVFLTELESSIASLVRIGSNPAALTEVRNIIVSLTLVLALVATEQDLKDIYSRMNTWSSKLAAADNARQDY